MGELASRLARVPYGDVLLAVGVPALVLVLAELAGWLAGTRAVGTLEPTVVVPVALLAYILLAVVAMRRVAAEAFDAFRPALGDALPDPDAVARSLRMPPVRPTLVVIVVFELFITGSYLSSPTARATVPDAWTDAGFVWGAWVLGVAAFATIVTFAVHQLRIVTRLHAIAPRIDVFRPAPINAFSRLTVTIAVALVPVMAFAAQAENPLVQVPVVGTLVVASFVLPLRGMHGRLVREKERLLDESTSRFEALRARLHGSVDARDLREAKELQSALAAVLTERDVIAKLPTWPWTTTVFRGFASAVLVPIVLWAIIRVLERFV